MNTIAKQEATNIPETGFDLDLLSPLALALRLVQRQELVELARRTVEVPVE